MNLPKASFAFALVIGFSGVSPASPASLDTYRLTLGGLGPLRVGMTVEDVRRAGFQIKVDPVFDVKECAEVALAGQSGISLMFENSRITRVDIRDKRFATRSGARVGFSEEQVRQIYGTKLVTEPHHYDDRGHYLKVFSADRKSALVFETDGHVVTTFRAGTSAEYVEGCL